MSDPSPFKTPDFWVAVAIALIVKVKTSAQLGPVKVVTTVVVAIGAAWVGAEYVSQLLGAPLPHLGRADHAHGRGGHAVDPDRSQ